MLIPSLFASVVQTDHWQQHLPFHEPNYQPRGSNPIPIFPRQIYGLLPLLVPCGDVYFLPPLAHAQIALCNFLIAFQADSLYQATQRSPFRPAINARHLPLLALQCHAIYLTVLIAMLLFFDSSPLSPYHDTSMNIEASV